MPGAMHLVVHGHGCRNYPQNSRDYAKQKSTAVARRAAA
jgi:hypothetical protein